MNILICIENLKMDGVKRVATVVGNSLAKQHNVFYYSLSSAGSFFHLEAPLIKAKHPINSGKSFREDLPLKKFKLQIADLNTTIKKEKIDIVLLNAGLFTSFSPLIKEANPATKLIAWMHNNYQIYMKEYYQDMRVEFIAGLEAVDTVVTLTESDLLKFSKHNVNTIKIHNPVTLVSNHKSNLNKNVIVAVCRIDIKHKGLDYLLELAQRLPDNWQIRLAGDGPDKEWLKNEVHSKKIEKQFIILGALSDAKLREHYRNGSIFVITSRWEGFPLVIGEAMNFGLPIVSMWNTGSQEYLQSGKYGIIIADHDTDQLYRKLLPLLKNINLRQKFGSLATQRSHDFRLPYINEKWNLLFNQLNEQN